MKAYININQKAFIELSNLKKIKLDLIDVTIFDFVYKFSISNKAQKLLIDNQLYIWCSYQKIIDDNPLMNITSKKAIENRLNKLVEVGLLSKFTDKKQGNKTFFNVTDLAYTLVIENTNLSNEDSQPLVSKITNLSNEDYYNSELIDKLDSELIEKEKIYKKEIPKSKKEVEFTFNLKNLTQYENLSDEYKSKLEDEIIKLNKNLSFEDFTMALMAKGYKYKNFLLAYKTWVKNDSKKPQQNYQTPKSRAESNRDFIREHYGINEDGNIIDTEIM